MMTLEFFLPMRPPTATAQEHKLDTRGKRPRVYDPPAVREARAKLEAHLAAHAPQEPFEHKMVLPDLRKTQRRRVPYQQAGYYEPSKAL